MQLSVAGGQVTTEIVDRNAFDPSAIEWGKLGSLGRPAIAKSKLDGAKVNEWAVRKLPAGLVWTIYLQAPRGTSTIDADVHGNITNVEH